MTNLQTNGRLIVCGQIKAVSGLHIGALNPGLQVGGIDLPVVRNPLSNHPFIPGSSLRGKMRSLLERHFNLCPNKAVQEVRIHECETSEEYKDCPVCRIFGVSVDVVDKDPTFRDQILHSRLIVRDAPLNANSATKLEGKKTDLPYTEAKLEIAIDRITSQAVPRTVERVPAGALFDFRLVFKLLVAGDEKLFENVLLGMRLLEEDYLGGLGVRGSGEVKFKKVSVRLRRPEYYQNNDGEEELAGSQTVTCLQNTSWAQVISEKLNPSTPSTSVEDNANEQQQDNEPVSPKTGDVDPASHRDGE